MSLGERRRAAEDEAFMRRALEEAQKGVGRTSPNPAVGAVIVRAGRVLAVGHHTKAGEDHAEVAALKRAGAKARGATLYATLEPCVHFGRTPPCTHAILAAGITRVVVGTSDPNPKVSGRGLRALRRAGVEVVTGVLEEDCRALNEAFNHAITHSSPFVLLKAAVSFDGRIATRTGASKWITGPAARRKGHELRAQMDAVVVGVGTAVADDPLLTARIKSAKDPLRVVLDSKLRLPIKSQLAKTAKRVPTLVVTTEKAPGRKRAALERLGVEVLGLPADRDGRPRLSGLLDVLHRRGLNGVLVEGGATVHGAFLDAGLVHRVVFFMAPKLIGGRDALSAIGGRGVVDPAQAFVLEELEASPLGEDLMLTARVRPRRS